MPPPARTTTGCWTCRIRKKKCDDVQPFCGPCTARHITCHGYGLKPGWMDSAENQKAEIEKIKKAVNQNLRSARAFRVSKTQTVQPRVVQAASGRGRFVTSKLAYPQQADEVGQNTLGIGDLPIEAGAGWGSDEALSLRGRRPYIVDASGGSYPAQLPILSSSSADTYQIQEHTLHLAGKEAAYPFLYHPHAPPAENEHDLTMIMNYLDNIFPLQYYFYRPSASERGRGWLLSLLLRSKSSYFAALAFSVIQQIIFVFKDNTAMEQNLSVDMDRYHSLTLSELQQQLDYLPTISGYEHLKLGVEILACMMQLLSIDVFRQTKEYDGWKGDWEVHLHGAETLLSVIGTDLQTSTSNSPTGDEYHKQQTSEAETVVILPALDEIAGLDFFLKAYIWSHIICCASIGRKASDRDSFSYITYLVEDRICLEHTMGCRNWAMLAIREISNLASWKNDMQSRRCLSIPMLARRAAAIEESLHDGLQTVMKDQNALTPDELECNLLTEIYALSALTYLQIVVSGNSHLLPEVRSRVGQALVKLKALPPHLLVRVSWPYCVAGCMADETEKEEFRQLLFAADNAGHLLGTLWNGLEIMEQFWILRENLDTVQLMGDCAWVVAMESLGVKILLI